MKTEIDERQSSELEHTPGAELLRPLVIGQPARGAAAAPPSLGILVGELIAMTENRLPMVLYPGQSGSAAVAARSIVDLRADQVGKHVVLAFEGTDAARPIIIGVLVTDDGVPASEQLGHTHVDVDGERLVVSAARQLVLRCGEASITLTKEGKILLRGTFVSSQSSGVNRIKGGSVQIN